VGWSQQFTGVAGESDTSSGVLGSSQRQYGVLGQTGHLPFGPRLADPNNPGAGDKGSVPAGVCGTATDAFGVAGLSLNASGVLGQSGPAPAYDPNLNYTGGVVGTSRDAVGVVAVSQNSFGVVATSQNSFGVITTSQNGAGAVAYSQNGAGVVAISGTWGPGVPNTIDPLAGVMGTSAKHIGVLGTSSNEAGVAGYSANGYGIYGQGGAGAAYFRGNVIVNGDFTVLPGNAKNVAMHFPDGSYRLMHCMESPEHWFEDFGTAKLKRGRAVVKLDADFAKTIRTGDYRVFLTPEGDCGGLYIKSKRGNGFEVRELQGGTSSVAFSYRIVGKRKDIKGHKRFAKINVPASFPSAVTRAPGKVRSTPAGLRVFVAGLERQARGRRPKVAKKGRRSRGLPK